RSDPHAPHLQLWTLPPRWRRGLLRHPIHGFFFEQTHRFLDGALELHVVTGVDVFGPVLDVDVRTGPFVFDSPFTVSTEEASPRRDHRTAIDERRRIRRVDEAAPRAFAHQRPDLSQLEHVGHEIAAGAGHFIDDHYLRPPDSSFRTGKGNAIARDIIKVAVEIALQHIDDVIGRRAAAVPALVD